MATACSPAVWACITAVSYTHLGKGDGHVPEILRRYRAQGGRVLTVEPHLAVFSGLDKLESGEKSVVDAYAYPSQRAAFDAAVAALKA